MTESTPIYFLWPEPLIALGALVVVAGLVLGLTTRRWRSLWAVVAIWALAAAVLYRDAAGLPLSVIAWIVSVLAIPLGAGLAAAGLGIIVARRRSAPGRPRAPRARFPR